MDAGEEGRWMTYAELADARGIDRQSARKLANRTHWRRQKDNHGVVRVYVPLAQAERQRRMGHARGHIRRHARRHAGGLALRREAAGSRRCGAAGAVGTSERPDAEQAEAGRDAERAGLTSCGTGSRRYGCSSPRPRRTAAH